MTFAAFSTVIVWLFWCRLIINGHYNYHLQFAYVVLKPGAPLDEPGVHAFMAGRVAEYKQLCGVKFVDEIPKSAAGKILRRVLRDEHNAKQ